MKIYEGDLYLDAVKDLIIEYTKMLNRDLGFQDFNDELNHLEKKYTMPNGRIFVELKMIVLLDVLHIIDIMKFVVK